MARIRTIKPEFPQSESMGNVSRDARLLFVLSWTLADDSGRLRGNSRMLASLLFPYDDDAPGLIDGWIDELVEEGCMVRYSADGSAYIEICNWLNHQKIDKPSPSKIPPFDESSRILANPREHSSLDQGSRIKDQGVDADQNNDADESADTPKSKRFTPPSTDDIRAYCRDRGNTVDPDRFFNFYESKGWLVGKAKMKDWRAAVRNWEESKPQSGAPKPASGGYTGVEI